MQTRRVAFPGHINAHYHGIPREEGFDFSKKNTSEIRIERATLGL
jgi:hypothetical protein